MSQNKQQYIVNKERSSYLILWYQGKVRSGFYGIRETLHPVGMARSVSYCIREI